MRVKNPMRRSWLDDADGGWIAHRRKLVESSAWRHRPSPLRRILDRIEIEHMTHAGKENGHLIVTYDQLVAFGVSRRAIRHALRAGVDLGLLAVVQTNEMVGNIKEPNGYRLTYVPEKGRRAPTDEWASVSDDRVKEIVAAFQEHVRSSDEKSKYRFPNAHASSSHLRNKKRSASSQTHKSLVPEWELLSKSATTQDGAQADVVARPPMARVNEGGQAGGSVPAPTAISGPIQVSEALVGTKAIQRLLADARRRTA